MRRAYPLIVICVLLLNQQLNSQILYKVNFHDQNYYNYEGLMVYFNESKIYMRVAYYTADKKYHVVNVNYKASTGSYADGSVYFFMSGSNPKFITHDSANQRYYPDHFIWRKGKEQSTWNKPSTTSDPKLSYASELPVDSFYQLGPYSVSETFLRKFFWYNEPDLASLKKLCGITSPTPVTPVSTRSNLHLVVVANTLIGDIGAGCRADRDKLDYEFRGITEALGMGYQKYFVDDVNFNKSSVQSTLNSLRPGSNDIVIFVYRGHGFRWSNQTDAYPMLDLRTSNYVTITNNTSIGLSEVYNTIKAKGARLNIVLGDCCNNTIGLNQLSSANFLNSQSDNKPDMSKLRRLFLSARGNLISAAARAGEYSWSNPFGGFYTLSFIQAVKEKISYFNNTNTNWTDVITYTTKLARDKSSPALCSNCTLQSGVSFVNVSY